MSCLGRFLRGAAFDLLLATGLTLLAGGAKADCDVPDPEFLEDTLHSNLGPRSGGALTSRAALAESGISLAGVYYAEGFSNMAGGLKQGTYYDGLLHLAMYVDLERFGFWRGLCFHTNGLQIHGQSITADAVGSLMPVSDLEAAPATRLFELWVQQRLFDDQLAVKVGQLAADATYVLGDGAFLNGTWGWPSIMAINLPGGGPAYPLATPGVHVVATPNDQLTLQVGIYNGDPAGPNCKSSPQVCNSNGLDFRLDAPPLLMIEGDYQHSQDGLAGMIKIGGFNQFGEFELQDVGPNGTARRVNNNYGLYGIIDQFVWRAPGSEEPKGVKLFGRAVGMPSDRNVIDFYADGGILFLGMVPNRPEDTLSIGFAYTGISSDVVITDLKEVMPGTGNHEALFEICYTMQLDTHWTLQPDFQYIWQPGAYLPNASGKIPLENAAVVGARTTLKF
jgi:porin